MAELMLLLYNQDIGTCSRCNGHVIQFPAKGQKTDFRDAIHIASMFRMDLVVASFIPPASGRPADPGI